MDKTALNTLLKSIGKRTFVTYFNEFSDSGLSNQTLVVLLQNQERPFSAHASATKVSNARRIFREGLEAQALSIIAGSRRVKTQVADDARALLTQLQHLKHFASSAHG